MNKKENILYIDFQGWPVYKKTLRELFEELKLVNEEGDIIIKHDNPILNTFPTTLIDDGMGYGVDEMFFTGAEYISQGIRLWRDIKGQNFNNKE